MTATPLTTPHTPGLSLVKPLAQIPTEEYAPPISPPEALLISALLEDGEYLPRVYGVSDEAMKALGPIHAFCTDYQTHAGQAPPVHLVRSKFPSFIYTPDVNTAWAAKQVMSALTNRELRKTLNRIAGAIRDEAHGEALAIMRETLRSTTQAIAPGISITDLDAIEAAQTGALCPIPPGALAEMTGGHGAGQLWMVAALWGVGKSWRLLDHAVAAAEGGWDVKILSAEMTEADVLTRLHAIALREQVTPELLADRQQRQEAIDAWAGRSGRVQVWGPARGRIDASTVAATVEHPKTLVCVDYVNKMYTTDGHRAGEDWRMVAQVSNELQEVAGHLGIPVLAAAQLNRTGDLGGSIALEQDADLILEISRLSDTCQSVRKNTIKKARHTAPRAPWYTRFQPSIGRFADITSNEALEIRLREDAAES